MNTLRLLKWISGTQLYLPAEQQDQILKYLYLKRIMRFHETNIHSIL
ncbi:hypothetical protein Avbf_14974 [Armadillidium vulgare]|nr:hypothetical protein Avbf_14974 [Armadillidium vulgare]